MIFSFAKINNLGISSRQYREIPQDLISRQRNKLTRDIKNISDITLEPFAAQRYKAVFTEIAEITIYSDTAFLKISLCFVARPIEIGTSPLQGKSSKTNRIAFFHHTTMK